MGRLAAKGFDQTSDINYQETYTRIHIDLEEEMYIGSQLGFPFS